MSVQIEAEAKQSSKPPVSLRGQLLWREFFYFVGANTPNFDRMEGNPICKQIPWDNDAGKIAAWEAGKTGFPWSVTYLLAYASTYCQPLVLGLLLPLPPLPHAWLAYVIRMLC